MSVRSFFITLASVILASFAATVLAVSAITAPKPIFTIDYGEKCNGTVNNSNAATVTVKQEVDGVKCTRVLPNVASPDAASVTLDCYSISFTGEQLAKARFAAVKYKYNDPDGNGSAKEMTIRIMKNGNALSSSTFFTASKPPVVGEWAFAYFDLASINGKVNTAGAFKQIHLIPFGQNVNPRNMGAKEEMLIAEIAFYAENPDLNATYTVTFAKGDPFAVGATPEKLTLKKGDSYILPENPYTVEGAEFIGWSSGDGKLYAPGESFTCEERNVIYTASFKSIIKTPDTRVLPLVTYQGGIVDHHDTAEVTAVGFDGVKCVKIAPNKATTTPDYAITLDSFYSQTLDKIDIGKYSYAAIRYYIDAELPREANFTVRIMKNGDILTASTHCPSDENIVTGEWAFALFDLSPIKDKLSPNMSEHLLRQIHITPTNGIKAKEFPEGSAIYLGNLVLFKEKPEIVTHKAYMKGYDGGFFKPASNMTRAEACTIVARLVAGEDSLVPTDKTSSFADVKAGDWYYKYVSYVESLGYLKSYSGDFLPNMAITRAEFVELVYNMGLLRDKGGNGSFTDVPSSHPKAAVIAAAGKAGLVNGYDNGNGTFSFRPDNSITRAEVVTVINNAYGRSISAESISADAKYTFNDVPKDFWAYPGIIEATLTHAESKGVWLSALDDPLTLIGGTERADTEAGKAYLATVDALAAKRISEIRSTPTVVTVTGQKYYVSADGNDSNDGKTAESAWKTLARVNAADLKPGDGVFLRRGDVFRERLTAKRGVTYSAYGENSDGTVGDKPRIYGSPENAADPSKWSLLEGTENIWVFYKKLPDVGMIVLDGDIGYKEIPDWYNGKYYIRDSKGTKPFEIVSELDESLDFFSEIANDDLNTPATLYLCCNGNPGEVYKSIELATKGNIINVSHDDVTIDNLCLMYGGSHGIGGGTKKNFTVTNCEVGMIGGSLLRFYPDKYGQVVRYGNGIEIYGGCDGYTVDNCYVYQCYDAGVTHQYDGGGTVNVSMNNITYSNNVIERCVYSIEYFNGTGDSKAVVRNGRNYRIVGNILRLCGKGWGQQRPNPGASTHIQGGSSRNEYEIGTYVIENNIFDRGLDSLVRTGAGHVAWAPIYRGNTYIQHLGAPLGMTAGTTKLVYDYAADITVKESIGDSEAKVYWIE